MLMTVEEIKARLKTADRGEFEALERSLVADTRKGVKAALDSARRRLQAEKDELERVNSLYAYERSLAGGNPESVIIGLDEVGRGSLAGPLAVGAVVLPSSPVIEGLNDSKQIKPERRAEIARMIEQVALACAVEYVEPHDIDRDGMAASLREAFAGALAMVESRGLTADIVLIDGNPLHMDPREVNVVKGDSKCASIAAASIFAKVKRDELMKSLAEEYPGYEFEENKGYSSARHIDSIKSRGLCEIHRRSFCKSFMQESLF